MLQTFAEHNARVAMMRPQPNNGLGDVIPEALKHPLDTLRAKYREFKSKGPMYSRLRHNATIVVSAARTKGDNAAYQRAVDAQAQIESAYNKWLDTNDKVDALVAQIKSYGVDPGLGIIPAVILTAIVASAIAVVAAMVARIEEAKSAEATLAAIQSGVLTPEQAAALGAQPTTPTGIDALVQSVGKLLVLGGVIFAVVKFGPSLAHKSNPPHRRRRGMR